MHSMQYSVLYYMVACNSLEPRVPLIVFEKANFNANDASAGWDGIYKGKKLNPDVFVYTIDIMCENNTILTYKGNVALIQ